jgi:hypothetical protein
MNLENPREFYASLRPVTRAWITAIVVTTLASALGLLPLSMINMSFDRFLSRFEVSLQLPLPVTAREGLAAGCLHVGCFQEVPSNGAADLAAHHQHLLRRRARDPVLVQRVLSVSALPLYAVPCR